MNKPYYYCMKCKRNHYYGRIYNKHLKHRGIEENPIVNPIIVNPITEDTKEIVFTDFEKKYGKRIKTTIYVRKNMDLESLYSILMLNRININDPNVNIEYDDDEEDKEEDIIVYFDIDGEKYRLKKEKLYKDNEIKFKLFKDEFSWIIYPPESPIKTYSPEIPMDNPMIIANINPPISSWSGAIRDACNYVPKINKRMDIKDMYDYLGGDIYDR